MDNWDNFLSGLSTKAKNCLKDLNIDNFEKLEHLTDRDILRIPGYGKKTLNDIKDKLLDNNRTLSSDQWSQPYLPDAPELPIEMQNWIDYELHTQRVLLHKYAHQSHRIMRTIAAFPNKSIYELGDILGLSTTTIRNHIYRAKKRGYWNIIEKDGDISY